MTQATSFMSTSPLRALVGVTRPHIVAIAALACLTFGHALNGGYPWLAVAFCALDWFLVNLLNRVVDFGEDRTNRVEGTELAFDRDVAADIFVARVRGG